MTVELKDLSLLTTDTTLVASRNQVSCDIADEVVVLSLKDGEYYGLNAVASSIWEILQEPATVAAVCDQLMDEYDGITHEQCLTETLQTLSDMIAHGLVERHSGSISSGVA